MRNLKYYFAVFSIFIMISCGENAEKKSEEKSKEEKQTENEDEVSEKKVIKFF